VKAAGINQAGQARQAGHPGGSDAGIVDTVGDPFYIWWSQISKASDELLEWFTAKRGLGMHASR
jgi:hypothetical protein